METQEEESELMRSDESPQFGSEKHRGRQLETIALPPLEVGKDESTPPRPLGQSETVASVTLFQSRNYKLCVSIGVSRAVLAPGKAVFDTGAGPNLVREGTVPEGWKNFLVPNQLLPRINNASGKRMPVRGVIVLYVQVGDLLTRVRFYVFPGLGTPCILGNFINLHVRSIHPKERRVDLNEGGSVAISSGIGGNNAASAQTREPSASMKVRLSRRTVIPARCEAHVEVTSAASGLYQILHHTKPSAPAVTLASGIAEIRANIPFRVRVINPTRRAHTLSKGMMVGIAAAAPVRVLSLESQGVGSLDSLDELGTPPSSPGITDPKRANPQKIPASPERLLPPSGFRTLLGARSSTGTAMSPLPLRRASNTSMKFKPSRRVRTKRKHPRQRRPLRRLARVRTNWISRTYPPKNASRYSARWSRITACGTDVWAPWPRRPTASRSSSIRNPSMHSHTVQNPARGSLKRPKSIGC
jgi:hypothetical protein